MLSKTSIVIMGMLCKGEMNAYDMLKTIDNMNLKYWSPIGATTLYDTCIRLVKKGYIEDTGKSETKAVYRITEDGRKELKASICALFERVDYDSVWFCLATIYSDILNKEELEAEKKKRANLLNAYESGAKAQRARMLENNVPYPGLCAIERMIYMIEMEQETLRKL